jgi:hypothetical protein
MKEIETKNNKTISSSSVHGLMKKAMAVSEVKPLSHGLLSKITKSTQRNKSMTKAIVEQDGIFTIQQNLETSSVVQDPSLKALVDSVLKNHA